MSAQTSQVVVTGAFDKVSSRHIRFIEEAAKIGELTLLIWSDDAVRKREGKPPEFPEDERLYFLRAIRYVTSVKIVAGKISEDTLPEIQGPGTAMWVVEASADNAAKKKFCDAHGLRYRVLPDEALRGFPDASPGQLDRTSKRKKVIVTGCYDWFHSGHVRFFEEVSSHGDLYVVVGHDANIRLLKGEGRPLFLQAERHYVVGSIRFVKQALISTGHGWLDAEPEIQRLKPDIYAVNEDGDVPEKRAYCQQHGIEYLVLQRKPAPGLPKRSSTELRGF